MNGWCGWWDTKFKMKVIICPCWLWLHSVGSQLSWINVTSVSFGLQGNGTCVPALKLNTLGLKCSFACKECAGWCFRAVNSQMRDCPEKPLLGARRFSGVKVLLKLRRRRVSWCLVPMESYSRMRAACTHPLSRFKCNCLKVGREDADFVHFSLQTVKQLND